MRVYVCQPPDAQTAPHLSTSLHSAPDPGSSAGPAEHATQEWRGVKTPGGKNHQ